MVSEKEFCKPIYKTFITCKSSILNFKIKNGTFFTFKDDLEQSALSRTQIATKKVNRTISRLKNEGKTPSNTKEKV